METDRELVHFSARHDQSCHILAAPTRGLRVYRAAEKQSIDWASVLLSAGEHTRSSANLALLFVVAPLIHSAYLAAIHLRAQCKG